MSTGRGIRRLVRVVLVEQPARRVLRIHQQRELRVQRVHLRRVEDTHARKIAALVEERDAIVRQARAVEVLARRRTEQPAYRVVPVGEVGCFNHFAKK